MWLEKKWISQKFPKNIPGNLVVDVKTMVASTVAQSYEFFQTGRYALLGVAEKGDAFHGNSEQLRTTYWCILLYFGRLAARNSLFDLRKKSQKDGAVV